MNGFTIKTDDPTIPDVTALLKRHLAFTREASPPGTCFALDVEGLQADGVTFWTARENGAVLGCIALKTGHLQPGHGEIKSLHCAAPARGRGVGRALITTLVEHARKVGLDRLSLETGRSEGFAASRKLYENMGFSACPAFGQYEDDSFSYCMTRAV